MPGDRTTRATRSSAGILLWRRAERIEVLLGHPGGPYFARKDDGHWTVPKGEVDRGDGDDLAAAARREFAEETGHHLAKDASLIELGEVRQRGGKRVVVWAVEGDLDTTTATSNTFELEWPPGSGRRRAYPEIDRVAWFGLIDARTKMLDAQVAFLDRLERELAEDRPG